MWGASSSIDQHMNNFMKVPEAKMLEGMYIAAGVGQVIAERACIAGAQGGCQAEIGSASCMAATAITYIRGGSTKQIFDAGAFALKSLLGLVCDPLGGLVEVPCIKRNVIGSVNAITASDMAMAGIESKVPLDEVIDAMAEVGDLLPCSLKETSQAGLAQTETGEKIHAGIIKIFVSKGRENNDRSMLWKLRRCHDGKRMRNQKSRIKQCIKFRWINTIFRKLDHDQTIQRY